MHCTLYSALSVRENIAKSEISLRAKSMAGPRPECITFNAFKTYLFKSELSKSENSLKAKVYTAPIE